DPSHRDDDRQATPQHKTARRSGSSLAFLIQRGQNPTHPSISPVHDVCSELPLVRPQPIAAPSPEEETASPVVGKTRDTVVTKPAEEIVPAPPVMKRKMTLRLKLDDYDRCRLVAEKRGLTFQSILETAVIRYLDSLRPSTRT
ncbi:MAG: hypothetical protein KIT00_12510, partial [Rhodospirillales bacterium]|nr:hypothetical protein [Rhodospirillales bacterium]